jgi:hypothetical protein
MTHRSLHVPIIALVALLALGVVLTGCQAAPAGTNPGGVASQPGPTAPAVAPPTIKVLAPIDGEAAKGTDLTVKVETTGLKFVMPSNTVVPGEGHVHFILDDQPLKMSTTPDYVFKDVASGRHTLKAELVQNDTKPFDPPVAQTVTFTVE